jgi:hypothetical protein
MKNRLKAAGRREVRLRANSKGTFERVSTYDPDLGRHITLAKVKCKKCKTHDEVKLAPSTPFGMAQNVLRNRGWLLGNAGAGRDVCPECVSKARAGAVGSEAYRVPQPPQELGPMAESLAPLLKAPLPTAKTENLSSPPLVRKYKIKSQGRSFYDPQEGYANWASAHRAVKNLFESANIPFGSVKSGEDFIIERIGNRHYYRTPGREFEIVGGYRKRFADRANRSGYSDRKGATRAAKREAVEQGIAKPLDTIHYTIWKDVDSDPTTYSYKLLINFPKETPVATPVPELKPGVQTVAKAPEPKPAPTLIPAVKPVDSGSAVSVQTPGPVRLGDFAQPSRADNRRIMNALDEHYHETQQRYFGVMSDAKIAEKLNVPRKWVEDVREKFFGPAVNEEMVQLDKLIAKGEEALKLADNIIETASQVQTILLDLKAKRDAMG